MSRRALRQCGAHVTSQMRKENAHCSERDLSATLSIHEFAADGLASIVAASFALSGWCALVSMLGVTEHTGRPGGRVGRNEFAMLRETKKGLVSVVIATERSDNPLIQMVEEALGIAVRL